MEKKIKEICDMLIDDWHKRWLILKVISNGSPSSFFSGPLGSKESYLLEEIK